MDYDLPYCSGYSSIYNPRINHQPTIYQLWQCYGYIHLYPHIWLAKSILNDYNVGKTMP